MPIYNRLIFKILQTFIYQKTSIIERLAVRGRTPFTMHHSTKCTATQRTLFYLRYDIRSAKTFLLLFT